MPSDGEEEDGHDMETEDLLSTADLSLNDIIRVLNKPEKQVRERERKGQKRERERARGGGAGEGAEGGKESTCAFACLSRQRFLWSNSLLLLLWRKSKPAMRTCLTRVVR